MFRLHQIVKVKEPDTDLKGLLLEQSAVDILEDCKYTGKVTQLQDDLVYVTFTGPTGRLTQVFKEDEIEEVK